MSHSRTRSVDSEMHELNQEADYLEEKTRIVPSLNGGEAKLQLHNNDADAQAMVIESLRSQIQDLFSQVSQLNNKLVGSYDRMSDLEDELHVTTAGLRSSTLKISELELERSQHLSALSSGLLVEKDHVTTELNRLMEKATEEAAQRGQAESARAQIEKELDDLSANLFNQANSMVAEARIAQARSERKAEETGRALREAEEVVGLLQDQMQALQAEKERAGRAVEEMKVTMGKGKWVDREYLAFIAHLRTIRPSNQHPPAMSTLLPLPFLARLLTEDSEPTVRLDLAPSLNWLSRRSVISAIHSGQLTVEPMSTATLLEELTPSTVPGSHNTHISCALCGTSIISANSLDSPTATTFPPGTPTRPPNNNSWSSSLLRSTLVQTISSATPGSATHIRSQSPMPPVTFDPPAQVYIFRLATTSSGLPVSIPLSSQQPNAQHRPTIYPLCTTKWCLTRLRTTCSLWAFVRTGIVEKIWEESAYISPAHTSPVNTINGVNGLHKLATVNGVQEADKKPAVPPRRSRMGIGALWGSVQRSLSSSGKELEAELPKKDLEKPLPKSPTKKSPLPPPVHPSLSAPARTASAVPPPLPKRNRGRDVKSKTLVSPEHADGAATPSEEPAGSTEPRTSSPSAVPLPPSPEPEEAPEPDHTHNPPPDDATTAAPSAPAVPAVALRDGRSSSRGVSPAPPPLPRRAAARPRPVSMIAPEAAPPAPIPAENTTHEQQDHLSVPPIPVPPPESGDTHEDPEASDSVPTAEPGAVSQVDLAETAQTPEDAQTSGDTAPAEVSAILELNKEGQKSEPSAPETEEVAAPADEDAENTANPSEPAAVDPQPPAESAAEGADGMGTEPGVEVLALADPAIPPAEASTGDDAIPVANPAEPQADVDAQRSPSPVASTNGVMDGIEGQSLKEHDEPVATMADDPSGLEQYHKAQDELSDSAMEDDAGLYVGDSTWEDRTWKELVRLREEMFWARIGGVR